MNLIKLSLLRKVFQVVGVSCALIGSVHGMELDPLDEYADETYIAESETGKAIVTADATEMARLGTIKRYLREENLSEVQRLVREELEIHRTVAFGSWLRVHAFTKGDLVLLYELARYSLMYERRNVIALEAGLKALLLLLVRTLQDVTVMNGIVKQRTWIDLAQQMRKKIKCWWLNADLRGLPAEVHFPVILNYVREWFAQQPEKSFVNPAAAAYWDLSRMGYTSFALSLVSVDFVNRVGIHFASIPAEISATVTDEGMKESIAAVRATTAAHWLKQCAQYTSWSDFFDSPVFQDSATAQVAR